MNAFTQKPEIAWLRKLDMNNRVSQKASRAMTKRSMVGMLRPCVADSVPQAGAAFKANAKTAGKKRPNEEKLC